MCYLLIERPLEQCVAVSSHHHEEQRQVGTAARPVAIQVDPQAHLVAVFTGIKGWKTIPHHSAMMSVIQCKK